MEIEKIIISDLQMSNVKIKVSFLFCFFISPFPMPFPLCHAVLECSIFIISAFLIVVVYLPNHVSSIDYIARDKGLTEVPDDIPDEAENIWLDNNSITRIRTNQFSHLSSCTNLGLYKNRISVIDAGAFRGMNQLNYLSQA